MIKQIAFMLKFIDKELSEAIILQDFFTPENRALICEALHNKTDFTIDEINLIMYKTRSTIVC